MGPEKYVQTRCNDLLRSRGYIVLRYGINGWPDVIALHPSGMNTGWKGGRPDPRAVTYCKWQGSAQGNTRIIKYGVNFYDTLKHTKLFLEYKEPSGGVISPRQKVIISRLQAAGTAAFISSEAQLSELLSSIST